MRLKEKAEEDIYFAKRDRELIRALHENQLAERPKGSAEEKNSNSMKLQEHTVETSESRYAYGSIAKYLRKLTGKLLKRKNLK